MSRVRIRPQIFPLWPPKVILKPFCITQNHGEVTIAIWRIILKVCFLWFFPVKRLKTKFENVFLTFFLISLKEIYERMNQVYQRDHICHRIGFGTVCFAFHRWQLTFCFFTRIRSFRQLKFDAGTKFFQGDVQSPFPHISDIAI